MNNKLKFLSISAAIFISSFLLVEKVLAGSCGDVADQQCVANDCGSTMTPATPASAFTCDASFVCCVPKPCTGSVGCVTTSSCETIITGSCDSGKSCCDKFKSATTPTPTSCADLVTGADCFDSTGKAGKCKGGSCSTGSSSDESDESSSESGSGWNSDDLDQFGLPDAGGTGDVSEVIIGVLDWLLAIVGILAIIALVISGFQYYMVATDEKMMEAAKKTMRSAIVGLIVALSGFIAIQAIDSMLNADSLF